MPETAIEKRKRIAALVGTKEPSTLSKVGSAVLGAGAFAVEKTGQVFDWPESLLVTTPLLSLKRGEFTFVGPSEMMSAWHEILDTDSRIEVLAASIGFDPLNFTGLSFLRRGTQAANLAADALRGFEVAKNTARGVGTSAREIREIDRASKAFVGALARSTLKPQRMAEVEKRGFDGVRMVAEKLGLSTDPKNLTEILTNGIPDDILFKPRGLRVGVPTPFGPVERFSTTIPFETRPSVWAKKLAGTGDSIRQSYVRMFGPKMGAAKLAETNLKSIQSSLRVLEQAGIPEGLPEYKWKLEAAISQRRADFLRDTVEPLFEGMNRDDTTRLMFGMQAFAGKLHSNLTTRIPVVGGTLLDTVRLTDDETAEVLSAYRKSTGATSISAAVRKDLLQGAHRGKFFRIIRGLEKTHEILRSGDNATRATDIMRRQDYMAVMFKSPPKDPKVVLQQWNQAKATTAKVFNPHGLPRRMPFFDHLAAGNDVVLDAREALIARGNLSFRFQEAQRIKREIRDAFGVPAGKLHPAFDVLRQKALLSPSPFSVGGKIDRNTTRAASRALRIVAQRHLDLPEVKSLEDLFLGVAEALEKGGKKTEKPLEKFLDVVAEAGPSREIPVRGLLDRLQVMGRFAPTKDRAALRRRVWERARLSSRHLDEVAQQLTVKPGFNTLDVEELSKVEKWLTKAMPDTMGSRYVPFFLESKERLTRAAKEVGTSAEAKAIERAGTPEFLVPEWLNTVAQDFQKQLEMQGSVRSVAAFARAANDVAKPIYIFGPSFASINLRGNFFYRMLEHGIRAFTQPYATKLGDVISYGENPLTVAGFTMTGRQWRTLLERERVVFPEFMRAGESADLRAFVTESKYRILGKVEEFRQKVGHAHEKILRTQWMDNAFRVGSFFNLLEQTGDLELSLQRGRKIYLDYIALPEVVKQAARYLWPFGRFHAANAMQLIPRILEQPGRMNALRKLFNPFAYLDDGTPATDAAPPGLRNRMIGFLVEPPKPLADLLGIESGKVARITGFNLPFEELTEIHLTHPDLRASFFQNVYTTLNPLLKLPFSLFDLLNYKQVFYPSDTAPWSRVSGTLRYLGSVPGGQAVLDWLEFREVGPDRKGKKQWRVNPTKLDLLLLGVFTRQFTDVGKVHDSFANGDYSTALQALTGIRIDVGSIPDQTRSLLYQMKEKIELGKKAAGDGDRVGSDKMIEEADAIADQIRRVEKALRP